MSSIFISQFLFVAFSLCLLSSVVVYCQITVSALSLIQKVVGCETHSFYKDIFQIL